ncbi:hypothetical protein FRC07_005269, partial [Ceratobasidium sp. 392]
MAEQRLAELTAQMKRTIATTTDPPNIVSTPSGVVPGQAPFDSGAPPPPSLERADRSRRPTPKGEENARTRKANKARAKKGARTRKRKANTQSAHSDASGTAEQEHCYPTGLFSPSPFLPSPAPQVTVPQFAAPKDAPGQPSWSQTPLSQLPESELEPFDRNTLVNALNIIAEFDVAQLDDQELYQVYVRLIQDNPATLARWLEETQADTAEEAELTLLNQPGPLAHDNPGHPVQ